MQFLYENLWNDCYIVKLLRSKGPNFSQSQFSVKRKTYRQCTLLDVADLGTEYIEVKHNLSQISHISYIFKCITFYKLCTLQDEVICKATINFLDQSKGWKITVCTSCQKEIQMENGHYSCIRCKRVVPYPNKKYRTPKLIKT